MKVAKEGSGSGYKKLTYPPTHLTPNLSDLDKVQPLFDSVEFTHGQRRFSRDSVSNVSMLHYSALRGPADRGDIVPRRARALKPLEFGEILITFEEENENDEGPADKETMQVLVICRGLPVFSS